MLTTYKLKASEIDQSVIKTIQDLFKDKEIEIIVHEVEDDTEYLLNSAKNKAQLLSAIANVDHNKNLKEISVSDHICPK